MNNQSESQAIIEELIAIRSELKKLNLNNLNSDQPKEKNLLANKSLILISSLIILNILGIIGQSVLNFKMFTETKKELNKQEMFEYQVISPSDYTFDESMNTEGANGWETVTCRRASDITDTFGYECIMQRKK